jgi:hypothetical protein
MHYVESDVVRDKGGEEPFRGRRDLWRIILDAFELISFGALPYCCLSCSTNRVRRHSHGQRVYEECESEGTGFEIAVTRPSWKGPAESPRSLESPVLRSAVRSRLCADSPRQIRDMKI